MKRILPVLVALFFVADISMAGISMVEDPMDRALNATISIYPAGEDDQAGGGSGVVISPDGFALTNFHVVQPCGPAMKCAMADGKLYDAVVVGLDPVGDIALIKLIMENEKWKMENGEWRIKDSGTNSSVSDQETEQHDQDAKQNPDDGTSSEVQSSPFSILHSPFPYVPLGDSDQVKVGQTAIVMGNPFLLALDFKPCVSRGIISGVHRYQFPSGTFLEYTDCIQTDAAVNPGNSGGPLFNEQGEVVGIIGRCSFEKRGRVNVGIGYAVSSNQVRYFLGDLKSGRIVDHATMNALVSTDKDGRVLFENVLGTSDAYRSGLRYDDELLRFAGRAVDTANTFKNLVGIFPKNWRLPVTVRGKEGDRYELFVRLGGLHSEAELLEMTRRMIEPPIIPAEFKKIMEEQEKRLKKLRDGDGSKDDSKDDSKGESETPPRPEGVDPFKGYKEIEIPGPDGKPVKVLQKEHFIPDAVKPFYKPERGYANFYFNRIERDRVLDAWRKHFDASDKSTWKLSGKLRGRADPFSFEIDDKGVAYRLPVENGFWDAGLMRREEIFVADPLMHYQAPRGSGGLYTALYLMRMLAVHTTKPEGPENAEIVYVGTAPLEGNLDKLYDVCLMSWFGNDTRFYFDPEDGSLALVEMFGSGLDFPCELLFRKSEEKEGQKEFEVRYGRILFGAFELSEMDPALPIEFVSSRKPGASGAADLTARGVGTETTSPFISQALEKVVKIYGASMAGGTGLHGYQTGILVSPDGHVLTTITSALQADPINVVLDSGRKFEARLVQADPVTELALLKIPASDLPYFDLGSANAASPGGAAESETAGFELPLGAPVYAVSNPFNIAQGNEPATVQWGNVAARTTLRARRGVFETPYQGPIYVVDITTNNPGACGGALICADSGRLVGVLGKELRNRENNSWLNFAIPTFALRDKVREMVLKSGDADAKPILISADSIKPEQELIPEDTIYILQDWGILLVSTVGRRTPPFVDAVKPGSEAQRLGIKPDDLIVMVNNRLTPSLAAVEYQIHQTPPGEPITLTVERDMTLHDVSFSAKKETE